MSEEKQQGLLARKENALLSKEQAITTGTAFLASGILDVTSHFNSFALFVSGAALFLAYRHGNDIFDHLRPGQHSDQAIEATTHFIDAVAARHEDGEMQDQSVPAKLRRMVGMRTPPVAQPKEATQPEQIKLKQPQGVTQVIESEPMEALQPLARKVSDVKAVFPTIDDDKTLRLGRVIETGARFDPLINMLLGKGMIIAGSQGAGKSNLTGLVATCACKCYMSIVVFDLKREFYTLTEVIPNGIRAGHESFADEAGEGYYSLNAENAADFAEIIMVYGFQAIIDIPSYNGNNDEVAEVMAALLNGLMDWSQRQKEQDRLPCLVFTDEAHNFLPENRKISSMVMSAESYMLLQSAYSRMINTGRSYGYTMLMATQRIANIAKWSIANLQVKVIMAHAEKNDLDRCEEEVGKDVADRNIVKTLAMGTGIVVGFSKEPYIVHFDKQPARHVSHTPEIERAHNRHKNTQRPRISRVLASRPLETYEETEEDYRPFETYQERISRPLPKTDPLPTLATRSVQQRRLAHRNERLHGVVRVQERVVAPETPVVERETQEETLTISAQEAFAVWSAGNASVRELAKAMGITVYQATKLYGAMVDAGLIERKTKVAVRKD